MTGSIAIEFGNHMYVKALDNGLFTLGTLHREGKLNESSENMLYITENIFLKGSA